MKADGLEALILELEEFHQRLGHFIGRTEGRTPASGTSWACACPIGRKKHRASGHVCWRSRIVQ